MTIVDRRSTGTQRGYFEVLAPAPGGSLVNKDREVALHLFQRELQRLAWKIIKVFCHISRLLYLTTSFYRILFDSVLDGRPSREASIDIDFSLCPKVCSVHVRTSSVAGTSTWTTVLWGTSASMAMIGLVLLLFTGLVPGMLKPTTSTSMPQVLTRPITMFVGTVSPSAYFVAVRCRSFSI